MNDLTAGQLSIVALLAVGLKTGEITQRLAITANAYYERLDRAKVRMECRTKEQLLFKVGRDLAHEVEEEA